MTHFSNDLTETSWNRRQIMTGATALGTASLFTSGKASADAAAQISQAGIDNLHAAMVAHVQRGDLPGVVTLVSRRDETYVDAIGVQVFDSPKPMQRDTIFRIASMSKPVAGVAAMLLVEDGKLRLEEPVDRLLPELANRRVLKNPEGALDDTVPANRSILVSDLLTLRMGLGYAPGDTPINKAMAEQGMTVGAVPPKVSGPDDFMQNIGTLPLMHQPGEAWRYHTGLDVLGVLIARASGQTLEAFMHDRIFAPLGMKDTGFTVSAAQINRLPAAYAADPATKKLNEFDPAGPVSQFSRPPTFASAAGGLVSTADDYLAFARMMSAKGEHNGKRLLSEASVTAMTTDHITAEQKAVSPFSPDFWNKAGWGYGLAVVKRHAPGDPRGFGWDGGYGTSAFWDPETGVIGILLTQRMMDSPSPPPWHRDFWRSVYESVEG